MTQHSIERAKERANFSRSAAIKAFEKAVIYGKRAVDLPYREQKYLDDRSKNGKMAVSYAGFCYIFAGNGDCITMFPVPEWFGKHAYYSGKERIKYPKRYYSKYFD